MRAVDLDLRELLDFEPKGGVIRFAGQRALLLDAVALGLLRRELIATVGLTAARGILTRFGYAHGWRTAEVMKAELPWEDDHEWKIAGGRLHRLQGLVIFEPVERSDRSGPAPFAEALWRESYEAEQHLLHLGLSDEPVCWTLCGFASGYLSASNGQEIVCFEERCLGKGDAVCTMVGRAREEWSKERSSELAYYEKDCLDAALARVTSALRRAERKLKSQKAALGQSEGENVPAGIVVKSPAMRRLFDLSRRVAKVDSTALITGESGVGKEVIARLIHDQSARLSSSFVAINCGAVPEGLLESELFGHARGAFTGATQDRPGLFEAANGGTLFLDEVGEVPQAMQVKLLRALQEREVRRVGENKSRPVDVRVVAATNRDLATEVTIGRFRQDLYYRLRVIELRVPPLRDRRDDILPLARTFLAEVSARVGSTVMGFTASAVNQLCRYDWPGNVRELKSAIERAVVLAQGSRIELEDLPEEVVTARPPAPAAPRLRPLADVEREHILSVLEASGGNKTKAALHLGIGTATLFRKLRAYGAPRNREGR
jgi:two-component system, NtrC family, response regulator HydG